MERVRGRVEKDDGSVVCLDERENVKSQEVNE